MATVRGMSLPPFMNPVRGRTERTSWVRSPLLVGAAFLVAVLIADAVLIAVVAAGVADPATLYVSSI